MAIDIIAPDEIWEDETQAVLTSWLFDDGARVEKGDFIAEIMIQKAQFEILAPAGGVLKTACKIDDIIDKGVAFGEIL